MIWSIPFSLIPYLGKRQAFVKKKNTPILPTSSLKLISTKCWSFRLTTYICYALWNIFQYTIDIPMGTNSAPLLADLFIYSNEADFMYGLFKKNKKKLAPDLSFNFMFHVPLYRWRPSLRNEKFEFTGTNQILEFTFIYFLKQSEKFTGPNKVLLVLDHRISVYREEWMSYSSFVYLHCSHLFSFKIFSFFKYKEN